MDFIIESSHVSAFQGRAQAAHQRIEQEHDQLGGKAPRRMEGPWLFKMDLYGGFRKGGFPAKWMVYKGRSHLKWIHLFYPILRKPPSGDLMVIHRELDGVAES